jgi:electron transfer flavoprotein alpha subunit
MMAYIKVHNDKVTPEAAKKLIDLCPFNAFEYQDAYLSINASCKICKLCVKKGPEGICELVETVKPSVNKSLFKGITVYIEHHHQAVHHVSWELIGKAKELAKKTQEPVFALLIGYNVAKMAEEALEYGVDRVFVYDHIALETFNVERYARVVESFYLHYKNNVILLGSTPFGRSFAPRIAARLKTGLTADCTMLDIKEDGDLLQIRPAFGGNIMAKINTPNHRPQLATIRYKMFKLPEKETPHGIISHESIEGIELPDRIHLISRLDKPQVKDISDADVIIAVGRAFKKEKDLALIEPLVKKLDAQVACTRPLIENGWFDAKHQIGLSGRTVKPKLIINLGISGAVQYIEGMKEADLIITVNQDEHNKLFDISHYSIVGDLYEVLPELNKLIDQIWQVK